VAGVKNNDTSNPSGLKSTLDEVSDFVVKCLPALSELARKGARFTPESLELFRDSFREAIMSSVEQWNQAMMSRHPDTAAKKARFLHFLKEAGGDGRKDIRTYFDLIEFDEGRLK